MIWSCVKKERERLQQAAFAEKLRKDIAGRIEERYPHVQELTFELRYHDPDGLAVNPSYKPSFRREVRGPGDSALFTFPCIENRECINGGFDLTKSVSDMLSDRLSELPEDTISCWGWQDRERIGAHRCLCALTYKVTVKYK